MNVLIRNRIIASLYESPKTSKQLQDDLGIDAAKVNSSLQVLSKAGAIKHNGAKSNPAWSVTNRKQAKSAVEAAQLQATLSVAWRGTPWQGLERVI